MRLSIRAWRGNHYVSLSELLLLIGRFFAENQWFVQVQEVAPEPGAELLEACDPAKPLTIDELHRIAAPNIQIVDGQITAIGNDGKIYLLLHAVDSTSWDVETDHTEALSTIREVFSEAIEIPD